MMASSAGTLLRARGVEKNFGGVRALRGVDFELRRGEVHALLGENGAGKSTLVNVLSGVISDYEGRVEIGGREVAFRGPGDAQAAGLATIHQELDLVLDMTVAENLFLGREPRTPLRLFDRRRLLRDAEKALEEAGISLDPNRKVRSLRVGERQMVEIARALSLAARILIMDEPTAALADAEVEHLFSVVRDLRRREVGVIYISHRLEELEEVADRATVFRNGEVVGTIEMAKARRGQLIRMMVGQPVSELYPNTGTEKKDELLRVEGLSVRPRRGRSEPRDVSVNVARGEIVGLAGIMGSGRTELLETLFGMGASGARSGSVSLEGKDLELGSPRQAIAAGIGFVPEDRKELGLVLEHSVNSNTTIAALRRFARAGLMSGSLEREAVDRIISDLNIRASGRFALVRTLSGGNQQKVLFGRQLLTRPRLLLLDEPTRGVDVGAKAEIYRLLSGLAGDGMSEYSWAGRRITRRRFLGVAATGAGLAVLGACGGGGQGSGEENFLIGMSQANVAEPYREVMDDDIRRAASKVPQFEVQFADAAQDNAKQVSDVENFLTQQVDLLIISPNEAAPLTDVVQRVHEQGIPVIVLDRKVNGDAYTTFIGADNFEIGKRAGEYYVDTLLPDGGSVVQLKGLPGSTPAQERENGFKAGIEGSNIEIIATGVGDWLREKGQQQFEAILQAEPSINAVYSHNDPMAEGAYLAAKAVGRQNEMEFTGIDGLPIPSGGIRAVQEGRLQMTLVYPTGGREAIDSAKKILLQDKDVPKTQTLSTTLVTKENAEEVYAELRR